MSVSTNYYFFCVCVPVKAALCMTYVLSVSTLLVGKNVGECECRLVRIIIIFVVVPVKAAFCMTYALSVSTLLVGKNVG